MSGIQRAGLIFGALALVSNLLLGIMALYVFAPILNVIWGLAAGIYAEKWSTSDIIDTPSILGTKAGAIAGVGALVGLALGMTIWFSMLGGRELSIDLTRTITSEQGLELPSNAVMQELARYSLVSLTCCFGVLSILILAAAGRIGARLAHSSQNRSG
jgi:hypothetical protein